MKHCAVCGHLLTHDGGLCARCATRLRLDALNAEYGSVSVAPTYTVTQALSALCADARCSQTRKTGSVFCAECDRRITAARANRPLPTREDELADALAEAGWYEGRLSITGENPRGSSDMLGVLGVVVFVLALLWTIGWLQGLPVPQRMGMAALVTLFLMALYAARRPE